MSEAYQSTALGDFLRSRRARVTPEDAGIASYGMRRVPGLRREELALLAGVSVTYYTRLEQGQSNNASKSVIDALARALSLTEDEHAHLHDLARPAARKPRRSARPDHVRAGTKTLIDAMTGDPGDRVGPLDRGAGLEPAGPRPHRRALRLRRAREAQHATQPDPNALPRLATPASCTPTGTRRLRGQSRRCGSSLVATPTTATSPISSASCALPATTSPGCGPGTPSTTA